MPYPISLVDLFLSSGTYQYSDADVAALPEYLPRLLAPVSIEYKLPDPTYNLPGVQEIEVLISNIDQGTQAPLSPSLSRILQTEDPTGQPARIRLYDPATATVLTQIDGIIVFAGGMTQLSSRLVIQGKDADAFTTLIPKIRTLDRYPSADPTSTRQQDPTTIVPFGVMRRVDLTLVEKAILQFSVSIASIAADNFYMEELTNVSDYVIQPGDYLYYDVLWSGPGQYMTFTLFTGDGFLLGAGESDQNGISAVWTEDLWPQIFKDGVQRWYKRKIAISDMWIGKTVISYVIACHADPIALYLGWFSNVFIGDKYGNIHKYIMTDELGTPTSTLWSRNSVSNTGSAGFNRLYDYGPIRYALGAALSLGGGASITIGSPDNFNQLSFSFEIFFRTTQGDSRAIANRTRTSGHGWGLYVQSGKLFAQFITSGGSFGFVSPGAVNDNVWHRASLVVSDTPTKFAVLFLDGVAVASQAYTGSLTLGGGVFTFGGAFGGAANWIGDLDDARYWNRALTTAEIQNLKNGTQPLAGTESGLYGYWPFDERLSTQLATIQDWSGRGNSGTISGTPATVAGALPATRIVTAYREARVVAATDWNPAVFLDLHVRFARDQRDSSGKLMRIQADLFCLEFNQSPAVALNWALTDTTNGLGLTVNAGARATAIADYVALGQIVGGGLNRPVVAGEVVQFLLMHGARLTKNASQEYVPVVDRLAVHSASAVQIGQGDSFWQNCVITDFSIADLRQRLSKLTVFGVHDAGLNSEEKYLAKQERVRTPAIKGLEDELKNPFLGDPNTTDTECDYLFKSRVSMDKIIVAEVHSEYIGTLLGALTTVTVPNMFFSGQTYQFRGYTLTGGRMTVVFHLWDAGIFTYAPGTISLDPLATNITDFSLTFPEAPTNLAFVSSTLRLGTSGTFEALTVWSIDAPDTNVTHMVFRAIPTGTGLPLPGEAITETQPGATGVQGQLVLTPGLSYTIAGFARNYNNTVGFQDGIVIEIVGFVAPGDTTVPAQVTGLGVVTGAYQSLNAVWGSAGIDSTKLRNYEVNVSTNSGFTAIVKVLTPKSNDVSMTGLANSTLYFVRVRAVYNNNVAGAYSATVSQTTALIANGNYGDNTISTSKYQALSVTTAILANLSATNAKIDNLAVDNGKIANLAVNDAKILSLSAAKILTGLLVVNPVSNEATAIFVANSGRVRLQSMTGSPAKLTFEDGSGIDRGSIGGDNSGGFIFQGDSFIQLTAPQILFSGPTTILSPKFLRTAGAVGAAGGYVLVTDTATGIQFKLQAYNV